jgi:hypothetical protein
MWRTSGRDGANSVAPKKRWEIFGHCPNFASLFSSTLIAEIQIHHFPLVDLFTLSRSKVVAGASSPSMTRSSVAAVAGMPSPSSLTYVLLDHLLVFVRNL